MMLESALKSPPGCPGFTVQKYALWVARARKLSKFLYICELQTYNSEYLLAGVLNHAMITITSQT